MSTEYADPVAFDREHVILLSDWTDENPARVFSKLKKQSDYYHLHQRTLGTLLREIRAQGLKTTLAERRAWGQMRMAAGENAQGLRLATGVRWWF